MAHSLIADKTKTALVIIDLQKGIVGRSCQPYDPSLVVENASGLGKSFQEEQDAGVSREGYAIGRYERWA